MTQIVARAAALFTAGVALVALFAPPASAGAPAESPLQEKQFWLPELHYSTANVPLPDVLAQLPNRGAWQRYMAGRAALGAGQVYATIDPRSGAASDILAADPVIPGRGVGNAVTLESLGARLGHPVTVVDPAVVAEVMRLYVVEHAGVLGVLPGELGPLTAAQVNPDLWQVSLFQVDAQQHPMPGRLAATISHGNVVTIGTASWAASLLDGAEPRVTADDALAAGFDYADGRTAKDVIVSPPALSVVAFAPPEHQSGDRFTGPLGRGYGHRLVWIYRFRRPSDPGTWEVTIDAQSGAVIAFADRDLHMKKRITGAVYPLTDTETCPTPGTCGVMQAGAPMPFADTGLPAPNDVTNSAGMFDYPGGTVTTHLGGRFFQMDSGTAPFEASSATGSIFLGGSNGQHDLTGPDGAESANNPPTRTAFYELNKIAEIGRGYLHNSNWAFGPQFAFMNDTSFHFACDAAYQPGLVGTLHYLRSGERFGNTCRNPGEIASVLDHEWGHGLDDNDAIGELSNPSETYADITAMFRTQTSCLGHGFYISKVDPECGFAADGSGPNARENALGPLLCATNCSGNRDGDWKAHAPAFPSTPVGYVCTACGTTGAGPCGGEVHCAAAPSNQAAWDLVTLDLPAAPFGLDRQSAFIVGSRLFYQGSGNIGAWYACGCGGGTSDGCATENAYVQWAAADDDNGSLLDGTPHMAALFSAFDRHGIACRSFPHVSSGCGGGPSAAPTLTATPGPLRVSLSWSAVPGAARYWVFRTEGHAGCDYGKALIAEVTGQTYTDSEVAPGRAYSYSVMAAGSSSACFGPASACKTVLPTATFTLACSPTTIPIPGTSGSGTSTCTIGSIGSFDTPVGLGCSGLPGISTCAFTPATVAPPGTSTLRVTALSVSPGNHPFQVLASDTSNPLVRKAAQMVLAMGADSSDQMATFDTTLHAPRCPPTSGRSCDTGPLLVSGRGTLGPEPNQPNTIGGSCADGSAPVTPTNGANERIRVESLDGNPLTAGGTAVITATVTARSAFAQDAADFFIAADAQQPSWVPIGTMTPTAAGAQTLGKKYVLPAGPLQAVRVQYRRGGSAAACAAGTVNDRDDLVFAVGAAALAPGESKP